jgi:DNA-binding NarL/FixJ family response regulator
MGNTISGALLTGAAAANSGTTAAAEPVRQQVQQPSSNSADSVTLTVAEQVYQLYNQGQQVSQIATSLSLPVTTVNNYLGITQSGG